MVVSNDYRHKIFDVRERDFYDMKGTLTPPGSSPLRADCNSSPHSVTGSTPPSPEAPPTPDSAHMTANPANRTLDEDPEEGGATDGYPMTNEREAEDLVSSNFTEGAAREGGDCLSQDYLSTNQQPLTGARKRKASKVHKVETLCTRNEDGESSTLTCPVCSSIMSSQHEFTRHIRTHNKVIEATHGLKMYECGICKKQLSSNSSLDRHMLVHSGERPFRCHICGTHFTTNGNMHRHIRGHYRNNGAGGPGTGSDSGDSDVFSEGETISLKKRELEDKDEDVPGGKLAKYSDEEEEKELSCPACGIEQASQITLEQHVETEHPEYQISCSSCHIGFKNYRALHIHNYMSHRSQVTSPRLDLIDFSTPKYPLYQKEYSETKKEDTPHKCTICGATFNCPESWLLHMRDHTSTQLTCRRCNITLTSVAELAQHNQRHINEDSQPRKDHFLALLDLRQRANASLSSSQTSISSGPLSVTSPSTSPLLVSMSSSLNRIPSSESTDMNQIHRTNLSVTNVTTQNHEDQFARDYRDMKLNGQYPCRICREVFANLRKLKSHNLVHMLSPPYRCNLCSFYSNDKNTLKEHMKSHKGDTPFECNLCGLAFTTKANCERHIKNIHGRQTRDEVKSCMTYTPCDESTSSNDRTMETICHICKIDCKTRSVLRDHIRSSHPEGINQPYGCKICQSSFPSHNDTFRHMIQCHSEMVTSGSIDGLIIERNSREEPQDLSSIESILNFSHLQLPINTVQQSQRPIAPSVSITPEIPKVPIFPSNISLRAPSLDITPSISITPTNLPPYIPRATSPREIEEEAPLDLSVSKKSDSPKEPRITVKQSSLFIIKQAKEEPNNHDEPQDLSPPHKKHKMDSELETTTTSPPNSFSESADILKIPKPNFPMMYPGAMPLYPFHQQYPLLMNPFSGLHNVQTFNSNILDEYQKEIKRGLQFSSGGSLLTNGGGLLQSSSPSFQISSALALAAARQDQLKIPDLNKRPIEQKESPPKSNCETTVSSGTYNSEDDMLHFTMRNSVLVKKPKQRRYRTERPWRCDLCDKGFTLRSNMERHMKQQHPDIWQQRPKAPSTPKSLSNIGDQSHNSIDLTEKSRHDFEYASEASITEINNKEEEDNELVIDDCQDEEEEFEEGEEEDDEQEHDILRPSAEEGHPDLASVPKLLSTATSQSFPFFKKEDEICDEDSSDNCHSSDDGKRSAYSSAPQKQKCPYCSRKFPWSSSLVRHIRTHTGQKPYLCPVCNFPFTTKSNCDRHLQRKHPDSPLTVNGDKPYRCSKCPNGAFSTLDSLKKHEVFRHEKANDTLEHEERSPHFKCHVCDASLPSSQEALDHVAKYHPEQLTSLPPALTATKYNNNDHSTSSPDSTTNDMVSCTVCSRNCGTVSALREHVKMEHQASNGNEMKKPQSKEPLAEDQNTHKKSEHDTQSTNSEDNEVKEEIKEEIKGIENDSCINSSEDQNKSGSIDQSSKLISNLLGTKPDVIDNILTSKSTVDAAKLLGVR